MNTPRIAAVVLATLMACALCIAMVVWRREPSRQPIACHEFYTNPRFPLSPCPRMSPGMTVTPKDDQHSFDPPLDVFDLGDRGRQRTVFASFGSGERDRRSLFFVVNGPFVEVNARYDASAASYLGAVEAARSDAHVHDGGICFDLTVDMLDGSDAVERWQGRVSL